MTLLPGAMPPIVRVSSLASFTGAPFTPVMTSPETIPALAAGLSACGSVTRAPSAFFKPMLSAMSAVTGWIWMPIQPRLTVPLSLSWATTDFTVDAGIEKAIPTLPPDGEKIAVLTPTTSPCVSNAGPPELPLFTGASIWMKSSYGPLPMSRPRAETIPAVTVPPRPNGLPTASTQSPMRG